MSWQEWIEHLAEYHHSSKVLVIGEYVEIAEDNQDMTRSSAYSSAVASSSQMR